MDQVFMRKVLKKMPKGLQKKVRRVANVYLDASMEGENVNILKLLRSAGSTGTIKPEPVKIEGSSIKTIEILEKKDCCGCQSCYNICPVAAIEMKPDAEGYLYPSVDNDKCIQCGKCQKHCPAIQVQYNNKTPDCYAVMAEDDLRAKSASGAMFPLLADYVLSKQGYVCGAAYMEDLSVEHILIKDKEELYRLRGSKYVQSNTKNVYPEIEKLLKNNVPVLFSGCPCQVAGLYAYLGKDYEQLYTADLICHGVPSLKVYKRYLSDCYPGKKVVGIDFRNKASFGWSSNMTVYFDDGTRYLERAGTDPFFRAFSRVLDTRPSCAGCRYTTFPRQGDISIGDFWGVEKINRELNDRRGTSLVLVNSSKGQEMLEATQNVMKKIQKVPVEEACTKSGSIDHQIKQHPERNRFFKLLDIYSFDKAVEYTLNKKYDVGVIGLWYGRNYGSMVTYYALHKTLTDMGLSVLMINNPLGKKDEILTKTHPMRFANDYYDISDIYSLGNLYKLNNICDSFIVGSDQLWNYYLSRTYGHYYYLSFADNNKKKIAYGTSFGSNKYKASDGYKALAEGYMKQFDHISVREDFAVDMCKELFDVDAEWVTDPVFFCKAEDYKLIEKEREECKDQDYILAYILDPYKEKTDAILHVAKRLNKKVKVILDEVPVRFEENVKNMLLSDEIDSVEILRNVDLKEWLYCFGHSSYVITDSFHGTCFAIIYRKNFTAILNQKRGGLRFAALLNKFDLKSRLVPDAKSVIDHPMIDQPVDYSNPEKLIDKNVNFSREWLKNALFSEKKVKSYTTYPVVDRRIDS